MQKLKIEKVVFGGDGLAHQDGKVIFVPGVIRGETVSVEIKKDKGRFAFGELVSIDEASPSRIEPECPYVSACGGCQYAHMTYEEELLTKTRQVQESVEHHLHQDFKIEPIIPSDSDKRYRSGIALQASRDMVKKPGRLSYVARDNRSAVVVDDCLLAREEFQPVFRNPVQVSEGVRRVRYRLDAQGIPVEGKKGAYYEVEICGTQLLASANAFFQNNLGVTEKVIGRIKEWSQQSGADVFLDLYAGSGLFGLFCAGEKQIGCFVEQSHSSVECLKLNLKRFNRDEDIIFAGKVEQATDELPSILEGRSAAALIDPPRSGVDEKVIHGLNSMPNVSHLAYLSCDLGHLTRDLKALSESGMWVVESIQPYDMFPRTRHIEILVFLKRK